MSERSSTDPYLRARGIGLRLLDEHADDPAVVALAGELIDLLALLAAQADELLLHDEQAIALAAQLERERHQYRELFEAAPDPYLITDVHGMIRDGNEQARLVLPKVWPGRPLVLTVLPADRARFHRFLSTTATHGGHVALRFETHETTRRMDIQCRALADDRLLWLLRDVTEIEDARRHATKLAEEDRLVAEQLRQLDDVRRALLLTVSHDLRTPLAAIAGLADVLAEHPDLGAEDRRNVVDQIRTSARRVIALFSDLIDLERLERRELALRRTTVDVGELLQHAAARVDLGDHELTVDAPTSIARVDGALVDRILDNLLTNAAQHTPGGTHVWLRCKVERDGVLITVEDDGPGIDPSVMGRIFDLFQRNRRPGAAEGFGVGLALVRSFAEMHGGYALVQTRRGGGASFNVLLPDAQS